MDSEPAEEETKPAIDRLAAFHASPRLRNRGDSADFVLQVESIPDGPKPVASNETVATVHGEETK